MLDELISTDGVAEHVDLAGRVGVMALHGGLEAGTAEAAKAIAAASDASLYTVVQPHDLRWHVPSVRYDPRHSRKLARFLEYVGLAVSLHGFGRRGYEGTILVGGRNRRAAGIIARGLRRVPDVAVIDDLDRFPKGLRGTHPRNPVNLPEFGGVQLELSPQVRTEATLHAIVEATAGILAAEQAGLCVAAPRSATS